MGAQFDKKCMKMLLLLLLVITACGKVSTKSSSQKQDPSPIYASAKLDIKVYYEDGAEPYTDNLALLNMSLWDMFQMNIQALFEGRSTVVSVPKTLTDMIKLQAYNKSTWSVEEVQKMAKDYPVSAQTGVTPFQIFFVNGYASDNASIIGFHISNTKIMVIFKDVIKSTATGSAALVPKYVEQATIIHEMGHALGLVNNGVPMQSSHQDSSHGAHCSNENCVMYYSNEGAGSLKKYIEKIMTEKKLIMFDQQCLNDTINFQK
jgi:predicted Zn-dependent protease